MPSDPNEPVLYVLPRKDMDSLNHAGKMAAQIAHAANHAAHAIGTNKFGPVHMAAWGAWEKSTPQGFGSTIVYGGLTDRDGTRRGLTINDIRMLVDCATTFGQPSGIANDPTYPLLDGQVVHLLNIETCGWLFGVRKNLTIFTDRLILHPETSNF